MIVILGFAAAVAAVLAITKIESLKAEADANRQEGERHKQDIERLKRELDELKAEREKSAQLKQNELKDMISEWLYGGEDGAE